MTAQKKKILEWLDDKINFLENHVTHKSEESSIYGRGKLKAFKETKSHIENYMRD